MAPPSIGCPGASLRPHRHHRRRPPPLDRLVRPGDAALGCTRQDADNSVSWYLGEEELILFPAREPGTGPHRHGQVGWQHLAFPVDSRAEVDRLHEIATDAGWTAVSGPKLFPRFNDRYYASFVEDDNGIRLEFMHNPPRTPADD